MLQSLSAARFLIRASADSQIGKGIIGKPKTVSYFVSYRYSHLLFQPFVRFAGVLDRFLEQGYYVREWRYVGTALG
jgi:hypothetical protein